MQKQFDKESQPEPSSINVLWRCCLARSNTKGVWIHDKGAEKKPYFLTPLDNIKIF